MPKRLSRLTWKEVKAEMSIAGSPDKITKMGEEVMDLVMRSVDGRSIPELTNAQFALKRVIAELKMLERWERKRQTPKG